MTFSQPGGVVIRTFVAAYESDCIGCGDLIMEGDEAGYVGTDDTASCADCIKEAREEFS